MSYLKSGLVALSVCATVAAVAFAEEKDPTRPRVPAEQRAEAKAFKNPMAKTPENIAKGKAIYEGKGNCFNCHGMSGKGDGPAGQILNPSPSNFTNPKFHKHRKDGEMFWVLKHGSPGTQMVPQIGTVITEEEAWYVILYERSFEGK
jgi:mono/diheme cytochrome c family protein